MSYRHDVFISYRRHPEWTRWTRDHFKALLSTYLQPELGVEPDIFVDERIQVGIDWVDELAEHLATSKIMVAIFSGDYFGSDWCLHELDLMLERSTQAAQGKPKHSPLIVPVVVHDGNLIPQEAKRIQPMDLAKYRIAHINRDTTDYHEFSKAIGKLAPDVALQIKSAPPFDSVWESLCRKRFNEIFEAHNKGQKLDPRQFFANRPQPPTAAPKLVP